MVYWKPSFLQKEGPPVQKLSHNDHIDLYRHLSFCAVGGFFGCYAVLIHSGVMGNAQTVNLIELLLDALRATYTPCSCTWARWCCMCWALC